MKQLVIVVMLTVHSALFSMFDGYGSDGFDSLEHDATSLKSKTGEPKDKLRATFDEWQRGIGDPFNHWKLGEMTTLLEQNDDLTFKGAGINNLDRGQNPCLGRGKSLLVRAAMQGFVVVARRLVVEGADINFCCKPFLSLGEPYRTPLYWAEWQMQEYKEGKGGGYWSGTQSSYEQVRQILLDAGADESKGYFAQEAERKRKRQQKDDDDSEQKLPALKKAQKATGTAEQKKEQQPQQQEQKRRSGKTRSRKGHYQGRRSSDVRLGNVIAAAMKEKKIPSLRREKNKKKR